MSRLGTLLRVHLVTWRSALGWPWGVLAVAFAVNLAIYAVLDDEARRGSSTGGLISIYVVALVAAIGAVTQGFPFLLGLGATRRAFYLATSVWVLAQALVFGIALTLLRALESATAGWGVDLRFFGAVAAAGSAAGQVLVYAGPFLLVAAVGMCWGVVLTRWGPPGMFVLAAAVGVGVGALVWLVTQQQAWPAVGTWLVARSTVTLFAGLPAALAALLAAAGYLAIRRATV